MKGELFKQQNYKSSICGKAFLLFSAAETGHIIPIARGVSHKTTNKQHVESVCHHRRI